MVQFLSFFFLDFFNFCWVFQKFPFVCVTLYKMLNHKLKRQLHKFTVILGYIECQNSTNILILNVTHFDSDVLKNHIPHLRVSMIHVTDTLCLGC